MSVLKSQIPPPNYDTSRVNLHSLESTVAYAKGLRTTYGLLIIHNGIRYQIKHAACRPSIEKEGWSIIREIPGVKS